MLLPILVLFFLFLLLSAFFSSSETAFLSANPYKLDYLSKKGDKKASLIQDLLKKVDGLLATILIGNTLVNTAAASVSTFVFLTFVKDKNQAVFFSTLATTFLILIFSEITPKTYAAFNPMRLAYRFARPLKYVVIILSPFVKVFTFFSRLIFPFHKRSLDAARSLDADEARNLFLGIRGISSLRKRMISGALDIGSRSVREVMIPRLQIKALNVHADKGQILSLIRSTGFSRFPVFDKSLDNILGVIHAKDTIPYLVDNKDIDLKKLLRKPFFVPESASLERVLIQMQKTVNHLIFVVDEFGNVEGLVTLEDILEEVVGEIRDEYDHEQEPLVIKINKKDHFLVRGDAPVKAVNKKIPLSVREKESYTTFAGFFLDEFGRIPAEGDVLNFGNFRMTIEKMNKQRIQLIRIEPRSGQNEDGNEACSEE